MGSPHPLGSAAEAAQHILPSDLPLPIATRAGLGAPAQHLHLQAWEEDRGGQVASAHGKGRKGRFARPKLPECLFWQWLELNAGGGKA